MLGVFLETRFDELFHEGGGERFVGGEADGAFAGVVVLEQIFVGVDGGSAHEIEGAVGFGGGEGDERSIKAEGAKAIGCGKPLAADSPARNIRTVPGGLGDRNVNSLIDPVFSLLAMK